MRETKYKAWDKINKRMISWEELKKDFCFFTTVDSRNLELIQFTGLLDKHGVEIYEGDIIKIHPEGDKREIVFSQDTVSFCAEEKEKKHDELHPLKWKYEAEIIGNIYEDKDLIKQKCQN